MTLGYTHVGYLIAGWGITFLVIGLYSWSLIRRGRKLAQRVPVDKQRWMAADDADRLGES